LPPRKNFKKHFIFISVFGGKLQHEKKKKKKASTEYSTPPKKHFLPPCFQKVSAPQKERLLATARTITNFKMITGSC